MESTYTIVGEIAPEQGVNIAYRTHVLWPTRKMGKVSIFHLTTCDLRQDTNIAGPTVTRFSSVSCCQLTIFFYQDLGYARLNIDGKRRKT